MDSLDYRRDIREVEVFIDNISDFTEREMYWGGILRHDFIARNKPCDVEEYGVDNNGVFIPGKLPNANVDKLFNFQSGKQLLVEIKTIPEGAKNYFTFKKNAIQACVSQKAVIVVPRSFAYYYFKESACVLLNKMPTKIYPKFAPDKLAVRISTERIKELINTREVYEVKWTDQAKFLIKKNYDILFRDKKK